MLIKCDWVINKLYFPHQDEKHKDKSNRFEDMEELLKKQTRKVEKLQENIENTIFKHTEL